jgi:hypothetical protein
MSKPVDSKHWEHRPEPRWKEFAFQQPYAKGLKRLREDVLGKTDFDPATLWQWGTMQAMALVSVLEASERAFGEEGQRVVAGAIETIGLDVGRQILAGTQIPEGMTQEELVSFYATVINRIAYASLEDPRIDGNGKVTFDILWCPHQDHYGKFDCRIQRYFVRGMMTALAELAGKQGWQVKFDSTIPAGAATCHFTLWRANEEESAAWDAHTKLLEGKALIRSKSKSA